ncbi:MAG: hypothetical protein KDA88_25145, partial [Planctomycetaceae bacterium]|nr:hypothetical protein [Planctomycetaceae bacterium]
MCRLPCYVVPYQVWESDREWSAELSNERESPELGVCDDGGTLDGGLPDEVVAWVDEDCPPEAELELPEDWLCDDVAGSPEERMDDCPDSE